MSEKVLNELGALRNLIAAAAPMLRLDLLNDLGKAHALVALEKALVEAGRWVGEKE